MLLAVLPPALGGPQPVHVRDPEREQQLGLPRDRPGNPSARGVQCDRRRMRRDTPSNGMEKLENHGGLDTGLCWFHAIRRVLARHISSHTHSS